MITPEQIIINELSQWEECEGLTDGHKKDLAQNILAALTATEPEDEPKKYETLDEVFPEFVPTVNIIHGGKNKYQIAREVWDEYTGYEELFEDYLDEKLNAQEQA